MTADDVRRVLEAVTDEPALVFGSSGGAVTGLALAVLHPERVRTVVAHEPPMIEMLPDAEQVRAQVRDVYDTYLAAGAGAAFGKFMAMAGFEVPEPDPASPPAPPSEQDQADGERMLAHSLLPVTSYRPGIAALKAAPSRVVIAGGATSSGQLAHRSASALADALGGPLVEFPGGHGGFLEPGDGPEAFARVLCQVLAEDS
ncbi:alpha/beta hydrolase [Saccharopolyspora sp. NPDC000995]